MVTDAMAKAMGEQINREMYSSYLYLQMAGYFDHQNLKGFANWMKVQAQEEAAHAMIFYKYLNDQGRRVTFGAVAQPPADYKSALDVFGKVLEHEQKVTAALNKLLDQAVAGKDHASRGLLDWFVKEQVEEEASAVEIIALLQRAGEKGGAMFYIDHELGERKFATPAPLAK